MLLNNRLRAHLLNLLGVSLFASNNRHHHQESSHNEKNNADCLLTRMMYPAPLLMRASNATGRPPSNKFGLVFPKSLTMKSFTKRKTLSTAKNLMTSSVPSRRLNVLSVFAETTLIANSTMTFLTARHLIAYFKTPRQLFFEPVAKVNHRPGTKKQSIDSSPIFITHVLKPSKPITTYNSHRSASRTTVSAIPLL